MSEVQILSPRPTALRAYPVLFIGFSYVMHTDTHLQWFWFSACSTRSPVDGSWRRDKAVRGLRCLRIPPLCDPALQMCAEILNTPVKFSCLLDPAPCA